MSKLGLSPRVRGNLAHPLVIPDPLRSIPARAGEPAPSHMNPGRHRVYPRACGGTWNSSRASLIMRGLSPRVRGNHAARRRSLGWPGSIPARAGEPSRWRSRAQATWVYPRVCGGALLDEVTLMPEDGLSPRVRGSLLALHSGGGDEGSNPRVCGGAPIVHPLTDDPMGLSPRVRGNLQGESGDRYVDRSIPARAGEPDGITHVKSKPPKQQANATMPRNADLLFGGPISLQP